MQKIISNKAINCAQSYLNSKAMPLGFMQYIHGKQGGFQ